MPTDLVSLVEPWTLYGEGCGFTNHKPACTCKITDRIMRAV